ncbi:predicted tail fiber protein [Salmonella phage Vi06]|uniref:Predicted tail fiber protein n=1 Tax=Salmonella phage Vi06 TaxID=866889 RepID=E1XUC0_9CAUD|nr:tail fiber protein [Salmonella phage Vi06]CBV65241.1 predicted tail fiber protein [Salmonella phage Vi06]
MANVIKTVLTYPLDGSTYDFNISFEYLARKFIVVTLIGTDRRVLTLNTDYRFATRTTISLIKAWGPDDGYTTIELRRVTSATDRLVDFTDGSILRAYDLNIAQIQTMHVAEEARDLTADNLGVNNDGDLDARGRRIVNVKDPTLPQDAATKNYVDLVSGGEGSAGKALEELAKPNGAYKIGLGDSTVGDIIGRRTYIVGITGQSNAAGARAGGPNPANPNIKVWDGATNSWGSSDYTKPPFSRSNPHGNNGNNNIGLAYAHRLIDEHKADQVFVIFDAVGGKPIEEWVDNDKNSPRYKGFTDKVVAALATPEVALTGRTKLDCLIWAQGEGNALTDTMEDYLGKFKKLDEQFRSETWMTETTPMYVMGMSGLHTRYQVWQAQIAYCENSNRNCVYVNSTGLKTQYDETRGDDYTHWLGNSLWLHGYERIWEASHGKGMTHRTQMPPFYARGSGPWSGQADAIAMFSSLVSIGSATKKFPIDGPSAQGSITWGLNCKADGNYTMAGGHTVTTANTAKYSFAWGRNISIGENANYSAGFGKDNVLNGSYQFAVGRGHNLNDDKTQALGHFSKYTTPQDNPVILQVGAGTSDTTRKNGLTVRSDGAVEICTNTQHDPSQNTEIVFQYAGNTSVVLKMRGTDGVVRKAVIGLTAESAQAQE